MIIWSGMGWLVAAITFALVLAAEYLSEAAFADQTYYQTHTWPLAGALLIAALIVWFLGSWLHGRDSRVVVDKATSREMTIGRRDALFFIPMRYWAPILVLGALAAFVIRAS
jgi:hypothetical protein